VSVFAVLRYTTTGILDNTFDADGIALIEFQSDAVCFASEIQQDNKIVLAGTAFVTDNMDFAIARINSNGTLDTDFSIDGKVTTDFSDGVDDIAYSVSIKSNGDIIAAGSKDGLQFSAACYSGSSAPLPVELVYFTASIDEASVRLEWETVTELNNYGFEVERQTSVNGTQNTGWEKIGFVEGRGNSNSPKSYEYVDDNPPFGKLEYRLKQINNDGSFEYYGTIAEVNNNITRVGEEQFPDEYSLSQNYPNPFNPITTIVYTVPVVVVPSGIEGQQISLKVYDMLGNTVTTLVDGKVSKGKHSVTFDGTGLSSGIYFYKLFAGNYIQSKKMILIK
jgi:uncharacterized delta-60 repeat protein